MDEKKETNEQESLEKELLKQVEEQKKAILDEKINPENINYLSKLVDICKDVAEERKIRKEEECMRYRYDDDYNDGSYGRRGVRGTGPYSRYRDGESYGRRGVPGTGRGRYRGEDMMDDMYRAYNDYMDGAEYGNYGTSESMQKIEIMADSLMDFIHHIKKEAKTPEEKQLIEEKLREVGRM